jgi:hypothetical protein
MEMSELKPGYVLIEVVAGPEGPCLCIGDGDAGYRLAGPKPWGGGRVVHRFEVRIDELTREVGIIADAAKGSGEK